MSSLLSLPPASHASEIADPNEPRDRLSVDRPVRSLDPALQPRSIAAPNLPRDRLSASVWSTVALVALRVPPVLAMLCTSSRA